MNKIVFLFIISSLFCSCYKIPENEDITGFYKNAEKDALHYNDLIIREDSTYSFIQCPFTGDLWFYYNGLWEMKQRALILYEGVDFSDYLSLDTLINYNSDTLYLELDNKLLARFPDIKLSIDEHTELPFKENRVKIIKQDHWISDRERENKYEYAPVSILLRSKNYYAYIGYVLGYEKLKISLNKEIPIYTSRKKLTKYNVSDSILNSYSESFKVKKNKLIKKTGLRLKLYEY